MKKIKNLLLNFSLSNHMDEKTEKSEDNDDHNIPTLLSIGENKDAQILRVRFHPDVFLTNSIEMYDEPPLKKQKTMHRNAIDDETKHNDITQCESFSLQLKQYSAKLSFNISISPKLCELGYVRVNSAEFLNDIRPFIPICVALQTNTKRQYLYIPMIVELPAIQQRHGLFDDVLTPTLMVIPTTCQLYRYKLTEAFIWRYQYVRIREYTSLKMDVIGEIPCDLSFDIIGYPVRAILPNFMDDDTESNFNVIQKDLNERKTMIEIKQWTVFENAYWIKIEAHVLKKLPLTRRCIDDWTDFIKYNTETDNNTQKHDDNWYFKDKGYVIQQYLGHTVLECIGRIISDNNHPEIVVTFDSKNNLLLEQIEDVRIFDAFPSDLIAHIISFCDFEFIRSVVCYISKAFYQASCLSSCYHTAIIPSTLLSGMLQNVRKHMLISLTKCKRVDVYSLVFEDNLNGHGDIGEININHTNDAQRVHMTNKDGITQSKLINECYIEALHLEFITNTSLHMDLFNIVDFNQCLKVLKLTQCHIIHNNALSSLPDSLEELCLMNTLINVDSWSNLKHLKKLIVTKSANLHTDHTSLLKVIAETLPKQILESICVWDGEEDNKMVLKSLVENHNHVLKVFVIGGRICLYHPFSAIFTSLDSMCYLRLEIITVSCLSTSEIKGLVQEFGHQLRILEMYCPFVMEQEQDIYQWLLDDDNIDFFCKSLTKLEIFMCQAFPHHMKRYMVHNKWKELKKQFEDKFKQYRSAQQEIPLVLFDFGVDLNKMSLWINTDMRQYLIDNQKSLELNFGEGI